MTLIEENSVHKMPLHVKHHYFFLTKRLIFFPNAPPFHHRSLFFLNTFVRIQFCLCFYFGILFKPWDLIEFFIFKYFAIGYFSAKYSNTSAICWTTLQNHTDNYIFVVCKPITWPISGAVDCVGISNGKIINCFCLSTHAVQNKSTILDIVPTWPMKVFFFLWSFCWMDVLLVLNDIM